MLKNDKVFNLTDLPGDAIVTDAPIYEFHQPRFWGSRLVRCSLEDSGLIMDIEGKRTLRVPYQDITSVHLSSRAHGRNEAVMEVCDFRCMVTARRQVVEITNRSDHGVGHRYLYKNQTFNIFVREFHRRLLPFRECVKFRSGHYWYFVLALATGALTAIVGPFRLTSYQDHLAFGITIYLSAVIGCFVAAYRLRPRSYQPTDIPENLLPSGEDHKGLMA